MDAHRAVVKRSVRIYFWGGAGGLIRSIICTILSGLVRTDVEVHFIQGLVTYNNHP